MNNRELGSYGENLAKNYLIDKGYEILSTNVKFSRFCELDIVAKFDNTISFIEVKTRKTLKLGSPLEAVTETKYNNIKKGAFLFLQQSNIKYDRFQIDVIGIVLEPEIKIEHLENI